MGQWSHAGSLCAYPSDQRRLVLATVIEEYEGNICHVAHALGYNRSHIYRLIYQYRLWVVTNRMRKRRIDRARRNRKRK